MTKSKIVDDIHDAFVHQRADDVLKRYRSTKRLSVDCSKDGRTHQSFKDECDINNVMSKWQRTGVLQHTPIAVPRYEDVSAYDSYHDALNMVIQANESFDSLPSKVRARFANDPAEFLAFCDDPANAGELVSLGLAQQDANPIVSEPEVQVEAS